MSTYRKNKTKKNLSNSVLPIVISDLYINVFLLKMAQHSAAFSVSEKSREICVDDPSSTLKEGFQILEP